VGKGLQTGDPDPRSPWETIIGVVGDVKYSGLESAPTPQLYVPYSVHSRRKSESRDGPALRIRRSVRHQQPGAHPPRSFGKFPGQGIQ